MIIHFNGKTIELRFYHGAPPGEHIYRIPGYAVTKEEAKTQRSYVEQRSLILEHKKSSDKPAVSSAPVPYIGPEPISRKQFDSEEEFKAAMARRAIVDRIFPLEAGRSPYGSAAEIRVDGQVVGSAILRLSHKDNFCRKEGRMRALKAALNRIPHHARFLHSAQESAKFWELYEKACGSGGKAEDTAPPSS